MKSEILAALRQSDGYVSGQELCEALDVSRTAVWKGIQKLKNEGYQIEAVKNKGYHLVETPDILSEDELKSLRKTQWIGSRIVYYDVTDSTNIQAKRLAEEGSPHGTLVVADRQKSGRGRRGRSWESPEKSGIFMTLLLRPQIRPKQASMLTLVAAVAVARALRQSVDIPAQIKWPNDIVLGGKKICGILTEMNTEIEDIHYVVIGIGINVSNKAFPEEISHMATSIYQESGKAIRRAELIEAIWEQFEDCYEAFCKAGDLSVLCPEYHRYLANYNQQVRVLDPQKPFEGVARGITEQGELIVETKEGVKKVSSGEVSVRGLYGYV